MLHSHFNNYSFRVICEKRFSMTKPNYRRLMMMSFCSLLFIMCRHPILEDVALTVDPNQCDSSACLMHKDKMDVSQYICRDCGKPFVGKQTIDSLWIQTVQDIQDSIISYHQRVVINTDKIIGQVAKTKAEKMKLIDESKGNIEKAKLTNDNLYEFVLGKSKSVVKPNHRELDKLYAIVTYRLTVISVELQKKNYNERILIDEAMTINETMKQINREQQRLMVRKSSG